MEKRHVLLLLLPPLCLSLTDLKPPQLPHLNLRVLRLVSLQPANMVITKISSFATNFFSLHEQLGYMIQLPMPLYSILTIW